MKIKAGILFIALVIIGQLTFIVLTTLFNINVFISCFIQAFTITILGDIIGYLVLKIPLFNYSNLVSYVSNEIIGQAGFIFGFGAIWAALLAILQYFGFGHTSIELALKGGLIPAIYYMIMHKNYFRSSDRNERRLKRKL